MNYDSLIKSMAVVYGSPPYGWTTAQRLEEISFMLASFPKITDTHTVPLTTYLLFAKGSLRFDLSTLYSAVFSEKIKNIFLEHLRELQDQARVQVSLDDGNFKAEVAAFGSLEEAITAPHLDVSALYRYMAAIQQGMLMCVEDSLVAEAVRGLRSNPYLYFAYGDDFVPLMPIAWEEL